MGAGGERFRLIGVARGALDFCDFGGMREVLDAGMPILATENRVCTRGLLRGIDVNILALGGLHGRGAMAGAGKLHPAWLAAVDWRQREWERAATPARIAGRRKSSGAAFRLVRSS